MSWKNGESLSKRKQYPTVVDKLMAYDEILQKLSRYDKLMQYEQYLSKIVQNWKKNIVCITYKTYWINPNRVSKYNSIGHRAFITDFRTWSMQMI